MKLRHYQTAAIKKTYEVWSKGKLKHPLIVAPTGSGKSAILGQITAHVASKSGRVCIVTHRAELIKQDKKAVELFTNAETGVYSAMLERRDNTQQIILCGIQSVYKKAALLGEFQIVIIDEAHLIPNNDNTMYRRFLDDCLKINPKVKFLGLTATNYRLDSGMLHEGENAIFDGVSYEISVKKLIEEKFLSPIVSTASATETQIDTSALKKRGGEYIARDLINATADIKRVQAAVKETVEKGKDRKSWLLFSTGLEHAAMISAELTSHCISNEIVQGDTKKDERERIFTAFKSGKLRCIVNCQVLTTGFDAPNVDLIGLLTATCSTGLYVQMLGRGTRIAPGKKDCLLLDFGKNVLMHGFFDKVRINTKKKGDGEGEAPVKECPKCSELLHAAVGECPACGFIFEREKAKHDRKAYSGAVLSADIKPVFYDVTHVYYSIHEKKGKPDSVKIDYHVTTGKGIFSSKIISEWLCPAHGGYAANKYKEICTNDFKLKQIPKSATAFIAIKDTIRKPHKLKVLPQGKYFKILKRDYDTATIPANERTVGETKVHRMPDAQPKQMYVAW